MRFDFSHPKPISDEEIGRVETIVNRMVRQNDPVVTRLMAVDEAIESGARALFGEKYGDEVRVVSMGRNEALEGANSTFSIELCGGTHVRRTGDIGLISVISESAVASAVRRLEATAGEPARLHLAGESHRLRELVGQLKAPVSEAGERLAALIEERRKLERELSEARRKIAMGGGSSNADTGIQEVGGVKLLARAIKGIEMRDLKTLADEGKKLVGSGIVAIVGVADDGKAGIVVGVTADLTGRFSAVDLVRIGSEKLGGKGGGGRPDMAQAGGPEGARADEALASIAAVLAG